MPYFRVVRPLVVYLGIIFIAAIVLNIFLKSYSKANYNDQKRDELIASNSGFRYLADNPCTNYIYGDPQVDDNYIKVHFSCGGELPLTNTLAIKAIYPPTYAGAINLLGKINLFETEILPNQTIRMGKLDGEKSVWRCSVDNELITDFDKPLKPKDNLRCFYN